MKPDKDIYSNEFVSELFNSLAKTYDKVNAVTSFGFSKRWRKKFISKIEIRDNDHVLDLMCGMGECWPFIFKDKKNCTLTGVDLSSEMIKYAYTKHKARAYFSNTDIRCEDVFTTTIEDNSVDVVISGFGLKTLRTSQVEELAQMIKNKLKPGGRFTFIEMSVPENRLIRPFYMFYLKQVLPFTGRLFLGNPENYKMLGIYTEKYNNNKNSAAIFRKAGLQVEEHSYTMGCSGGFSGYKP